MNEYQAKLR